MHSLDNKNPNRIRFWIKENIHMVWLSVKHLKNTGNPCLCLQVTFYANSYPIVAQCNYLHVPELTGEDFGKNSYVSEDKWIIPQDFDSIEKFALWVNVVP